MVYFTNFSGANPSGYMAGSPRAAAHPHTPAAAPRQITVDVTVQPSHGKEPVLNVTITGAHHRANTQIVNFRLYRISRYCFVSACIGVYSFIDIEAKSTDQRRP